MSHKNSDINFNIVLAVWGDDYISFFMEQILPLYLTDGNLFSFSRHNIDARFKIYTLPGNISSFEKYESYKQLAERMDVTVTEVTSKHENKFYILSELHNFAIRESNQSNSAIIFMMPDTVLPDDSMEKLIKLRLDGFRAVMIWGFPVQKETFCKKYALNNTRLSGRDFTRLSLSCTHNEWEAHIWNDHIVSDSPNSFYWRFPEGNGYLIRGFHLHPIMVDPVNMDIDLHYTIDIEYIYKACPNDDMIYIVCDSDELLAASLNPINEVRKMNMLSHNSVYDVIGKWSQWGANPLHLRMFQEKLWVHTEDIGEYCHSIELESDSVVSRIIDRRNNLDNIFLRIIHGAKGRRIAIFGAGDFGQLVCRTLPLYDVEPFAIFDNDPCKWGKSYGPVPVCKPTPSMITNCFIVIAVVESYGEISAGLEAQGLRENSSFLIFKIEELDLLRHQP